MCAIDGWRCCEDGLVFPVGRCFCICRRPRMHRSKMAATFTWFEKRAVPIKWVVGPSLALLIVFVAALVYQTGGIKYVYSHSMYLPALLAGLIFGVRGGAVAGDRKSTRLNS